MPESLALFPCVGCAEVISISSGEWSGIPESAGLLPSRSPALATLGEEVVDFARTITLALGLSLFVQAPVGISALPAAGTAALAESEAPRLIASLGVGRVVLAFTPPSHGVVGGLVVLALGAAIRPVRAQVIGGRR